MASSQSFLRVMDRASGFLFIAVVLFFATPAAAKPSNFQQFFPKWTDAIEDRLGDECREVYGHLMNDFSPICEEMNRQVPSCRASRVIDCLSAELPESWKANMAAAGVLLGLLPTTLAILGSNSRETSLLALKRPFLALLLAIGTPGVEPTRSIEHADHAELLANRGDRIVLPDFSSWSTAAIAILQYLFACASAVNVAHVTWQLCILTVNSFSPEASFFPALWVATAVLVNIGGYLSLQLRTRIEPDYTPIEHDGKRKGKSATSWPLRELTPCAQHSRSRIQLRRESYGFIFISWLTSVGAIASIVLGTLVLSAVLYIGTIDAVIVNARFFASAMLCRIILNFEMAGMRKTVDVSDEVVK